MFDWSGPKNEGSGPDFQKILSITYIYILGSSARFGHAFRKPTHTYIYIYIYVCIYVHDPPGPLWAPVGPCGAPWVLVGCALVNPWDLVGRLGPCWLPWALVGSPWPVWAGPLWASLDPCRQPFGPLWAPLALVGFPWPLWAGPLWTP